MSGTETTTLGTDERIAALVLKRERRRSEIETLRKDMKADPAVVKWLDQIDTMRDEINRIDAQILDESMHCGQVDFAANVL